MEPVSEGIQYFGSLVIIKKDLKHLQSKLDNFELDLKSIQDNKYNYQITSIVLFIVITARGNPVKELKDESLKLFKENNIEFDKYYWGVTDKSEICKKENIELIIEDNYNWIKKLVEDKFKILYFRDVNMTKVKESEYLTEVNNWGDIYRYFNKIKNK